MMNRIDRTRRGHPARLRGGCAAIIGALMAGALLAAAGPAAAGTIYPVTATIPVPAGNGKVGVDPSSHTVYVATGGPTSVGTVSVIDEASNTVTATIPVGELPAGIAVDPWSHTVYVTNEFDNTVSVIDEAGNTVTATIPVDYSPIGVGVDPGSHTVYVANSLGGVTGSGTVSVIDQVSNTVTATIPVNTPEAVTVDRDSHTVYVTSTGTDSHPGGTVSVIDEASSSVTATIPVGALPYGVGLDWGSHTLYVVNAGDNTVSVIDEASNTVTATISEGFIGTPYGVAVDPGSHTVYVANHSDAASVSVIDGASNTVIATTKLDGFAWGVGVDTGNHTVYVTKNVATVSVITPTEDADLAIADAPDITTDATSPDGATVNYATPAVTDGDDTNVPTAACAPASGSVFPIGSSTVTCTASDAGDANSPVSTTFTVTVAGPADQLATLTDEVGGSAPGTSLPGKLAQAQDYLDAGDLADACSTLDSFINEVQAQSGKHVSTADATAWIAQAEQIEAAAGC